VHDAVGGARAAARRSRCPRAAGAGACRWRRRRAGRVPGRGHGSSAACTTKSTAAAARRPFAAW
jgi:hypothetical protein